MYDTNTKLQTRQRTSKCNRCRPFRDEVGQSFQSSRLLAEQPIQREGGLSMARRSREARMKRLQKTLTSIKNLEREPTGFNVQATNINTGNTTTMIANAMMTTMISSLTICVPERSPEATARILEKLNKQARNEFAMLERLPDLQRDKGGNVILSDDDEMLFRLKWL